MTFDKNLISIIALDIPPHDPLGREDCTVAHIMYGPNRVGTISVFVKVVESITYDEDVDDNDQPTFIGGASWPGLNLQPGCALDDMYVYPIDPGYGFKYSGHGCPISKEWLSQPQLMEQLASAMEERYLEIHRVASALLMIPNQGDEDGLSSPAL